MGELIDLKDRVVAITGGGGVLCSAISKALAEAGASVPFQVMRGDDRPLDSFELVSYRTGPARYLGLIKEDEVEVSTEPVSIALQRPYEVYDVRAKRRLGRLDVIRDQIRTAEPKFYALLPAPVGSITISAAGAASRGSRFR